MKAIDNGLYIQEAAPSNKFDQQIITQLVDDEEEMCIRDSLYIVSIV